MHMVCMHVEIWNILTSCRHALLAMQNTDVVLLSVLKTCLFLKSGLLCDIKFLAQKSL